MDAYGFVCHARPGGAGRVAVVTTAGSVLQARVQIEEAMRRVLAGEEPLEIVAFDANGVARPWGRTGDPRSSPPGTG